MGEWENEVARKINIIAGRKGGGGLRRDKRDMRERVRA